MSSAQFNGRSTKTHSGSGGENNGISKATCGVVVLQACPSSHLCYISWVTSQCRIRFELNRVVFPRWILQARSLSDAREREKEREKERERESERRRSRPRQEGGRERRENAHEALRGVGAGVRETWVCTSAAQPKGGKPGPAPEEGGGRKAEREGGSGNPNPPPKKNQAPTLYWQAIVQQKVVPKRLQKFAHKNLSQTKSSSRTTL